MMNAIGVEVTKSEITGETFVEIKTMLWLQLNLWMIRRIENFFRYLKSIHLQM